MRKHSIPQDYSEAEMEGIIQALANQNFAQSLTLLILTAVLTGILVPYVKSKMDEGQKRFDAELTRQSKIIESQAALLDNLAQLLWEFQKEVNAVAWYQNRGNAEKYNASFKKYDDDSWVLFGKIRTEISTAQRLTTTATYAELKKIYDPFMVEIDTKLNELVSGAHSPEEWQAFEDYLSGEAADRIDSVIRLLAEELRLTEHFMVQRVGGGMSRK
jgi:hypothetical protein